MLKYIYHLGAKVQFPNVIAKFIWLIEKISSSIKPQAQVQLKIKRNISQKKKAKQKQYSLIFAFLPSLLKSTPNKPHINPSTLFEF